MRLMIALLALLMPVSLGANPAIDRPALWQVADHDTTIWLFGTVHALDSGRIWLAGPVRQALDDSDTLVLEIDMADPAAAGAVLAGDAVDHSGRPIRDRIPAQLHDQMLRRLADLGLPPAAFDHVEPWYAAMMLEIMGDRAAGLMAEAGVEAGLRTEAMARGIPVIGLETIEQQVGFLDGLPIPLQTAMLDATLDALDAGPAAARATVAYWARGDIDALATQLDGQLDALPDLRTVLLDRRNILWAAWIRDRLARPGTIFVAVGAGHLGGRANVRSLLEANGLKVRRIQ